MAAPSPFPFFVGITTQGATFPGGSSIGERWDGGYGEWFEVVNRFKTKVSTMNVSLQLDTAGGTGVISSLVVRVAVA